MFTDPELLATYGAVHPSFRTDKPYETDFTGIRHTTSGLLVWMFSLRNFADRIHPLLPKLEPDTTPFPELPARPTAARRYLREIPVVLSAVRKTRKWLKRREAIREFPPEQLNF